MDFVMENSDLAILQAAKCFTLSDAVFLVQVLLCGDLTFLPFLTKLNPRKYI